MILDFDLSSILMPPTDTTSERAGGVAMRQTDPGLNPFFPAYWLCDLGQMP